MRTINLKPTAHQKSFYGKAKVIETDDGWKYLKSYHTIMAGFHPQGWVERYSCAKSQTTSRHIVAFVKTFAGLDIKPKWFYELTLSHNKHEELEEEQ